jgi:hypothetical protein
VRLLRQIGIDRQRRAVALIGNSLIVSTLASSHGFMAATLFASM